MNTETEGIHANALLIAAAPALLQERDQLRERVAALEAALSNIVKLNDYQVDYTTMDPHTQPAWLLKARAALAGNDTIRKPAARNPAAVADAVDAARLLIRTCDIVELSPGVTLEQIFPNEFRAAKAALAALEAES